MRKSKIYFPSQRRVDLSDACQAGILSLINRSRTAYYNILNESIELLSHDNATGLKWFRLDRITDYLCAMVYVYFIKCGNPEHVESHRHRQV